MNAKNNLAADHIPGGYLGAVPNINATADVKITPLGDGTFDYEVIISGVDGYPAYELWIGDETNDKQYLIFARNPIESGENVGSLYPPAEHTFEARGNSSDLESKATQTFEERKNDGR